MLEDRTWLLLGRKMAEEASPHELKELEEILKNNPELHFTLQTLTELWKQQPPEDEGQVESAYSSLLLRMNSNLKDPPGLTDELVENSTLFAPESKSFFRKYPLILAAISLGVIITIAGIYYTGKQNSSVLSEKIKPVTSEISTRNGSKTNIVLPDGTKVSLNAGSKLTYEKNFGEKYRQVILSGEAYFDVVHNAEKPFVIHTTAMDIKVLGTEFNVKSYPDERTTETSLIKGSIEVTLKDKRAEKIIMKPREKLIVVNDTNLPAYEPISVKKGLKQSAPIITLDHINYFSLDSTILETSWIHNRLIFEDESFAEVAIKMSHWYGVEFEFGDVRIQNVRFTGNFKNETVEEALKAMQITAEFSYLIAGKNIYINKK